MTLRENSSDPILSVALRIARRADEISRQTSKAFGDLKPWLRAEEELLGIRLPAPAFHPSGDARATRGEAAVTACSSS